MLFSIRNTKRISNFTYIEEESSHSSQQFKLWIHRCIEESGPTLSLNLAQLQRPNLTTINVLMKTCKQFQLEGRKLEITLTQDSKLHELIHLTKLDRFAKITFPHA